MEIVKEDRMITAQVAWAVVILSALAVVILSLRPQPHAFGPNPAREYTIAGLCFAIYGLVMLIKERRKGKGS